MARDPLPEVISSRARLRIADLISRRPRGLSELAAATGISVQAVLKHLRKLENLGLAQEEDIRNAGLVVRKVYSMNDARLGDFSSEEMTLVKLSDQSAKAPASQGKGVDLEYLAEEEILQRNRIRDQARRLGRMIDDLFDVELRIRHTIDSMELGESERMMLRVIFSEGSSEEAERAIREYLSPALGRNSIDTLLAKTRQKSENRSKPR